MMLKILSILLLSSILFSQPKIVAVSYFDNTSDLEEYNPLSKGLADMLITDLSNVKSIKIVEREKLESLLKEIKLGESKFMDESTIQKLGEGLGAGYILTGSYLIMGNTMRIDARLVNVGTGEVFMGEEITGEKDTFFELEKNLVEKLISVLNLSLSKSEERRLKKVQTKSFDSFNAYSSALVSYDKGEYKESLIYMEKAIEIDEDFEIAWDKLDEIEKKINSFLDAKRLNISEDILNLITLVQNGEEICKPLVGALQQLNTNITTLNSKFYDIGDLRDNLSKNSDFWITHGGFSNPPNNLIEVANHTEIKLIEYFNIINYLIENDFNTICGSDYTYGQEFIEFIIGQMQYSYWGIPIFIEFVNVRYDQKMKSVQYFDNINFIMLNNFIEKYPYSPYSTQVATSLQEVILRKKNPILYDFYKNYFLYNHPDRMFIMYNYPTDNLYLYTSDFKTIHIPPGLEILKDRLTEITIWYNPATKIAEHKYTREEIKGAFWGEGGGDTLNIPHEIYELTNLKTIEVMGFYNECISFSDEIYKLKNIEEIDMEIRSKECKDRLQLIFPNADID